MPKEIVGEPLMLGGKPLPLSAGVKANGFLFVSGQLGTDANMQLMGEDVASQTRAALDNLKAVIEQGGGRLEDTVKVTTFLTDAALARDYNAVYREYFPEGPPARSTVISGLLIPGALVEIEAIVALDS